MLSEFICIFAAILWVCNVIAFTYFTHTVIIFWHIKQPKIILNTTHT